MGPAPTTQRTPPSHREAKAATYAARCRAMRAACFSAFFVGRCADGMGSAAIHAVRGARGGVQPGCAGARRRGGFAEACSRRDGGHLGSGILAYSARWRQTRVGLASRILSRVKQPDAAGGLRHGTFLANFPF